MRAVQAALRQHVVDDFDRIVLHDADVGQALLVDPFQQRADAGRVHFAAEEISLRHQRGDVRGGFAHAETNFQNRRRGAAENHLEIDRRARVGKQKKRAEICKSLRLADRSAAGAAHETTNAARMADVVGRRGK